MSSEDEQTRSAVVGGVDTLKELHVAAVVDHQDRVIGTRSFASTRQGYRQMLAWMRSFGELQRVDVSRPAATQQASCASFNKRASWFWRSRLPTGRIDASAARTMISMRKMRPMQRTLASEPSRRAAAMA